MPAPDVDANKVIQRLLARISELELDKAILQVSLETLQASVSAAPDSELVD